MDRLAGALSEHRDAAQLDEMLTKARGLRTMRTAAEDAIARGEESLQLNPRRGRHRTVLQHDIELYSRLSILVTRVLGMTRAVHDHYEDALITDAGVKAIAKELGRAAHDVRLLTRDVEGISPEPITSELPALTSPLFILSPNPEHWILIGSLMEDMRRVRAELVGSQER
jgi:hypothetical protein